MKNKPVTVQEESGSDCVIWPTLVMAHLISNHGSSLVFLRAGVYSVQHRVALQRVCRGIEDQNSVAIVRYKHDLK